MNRSIDSFLMTIAKESDKDFRHVVRGHALQQLEDSEPEWILPGYLPMGKTTMAGKPKTGKSWLGLQLALKVATGGEMFSVTVLKRDVLYLAFEDSPRRIKSRITQLSGTVPSNFSLMCMSELAQIKDKLAFLDKYLTVHTGCKLVVIDTLKRFLPPASGGVNIYDADLAIMTRLHEIANRFSVCLLCIHHCRKSKSDDVFDMVSGSQAIIGTADTIWVFGDIKFGNRELHITGRDVEQQVLAIRQEGCAWELVGDAAKVQHGERKQQILSVFRDNADTAMAIGEIRDALPGVSLGVLKNTLGQLVRDSLLRKEGRNKYRDNTQMK